MLHITPDQSYGPKDQKAVIRFSFALPTAARMQDLNKMLSTVGVWIDVVGNFKLNGDLQKRAEKVMIFSSLNISRCQYFQDTGQLPLSRGQLGFSQSRYLQK